MLDDLDYQVYTEEECSKLIDPGSYHFEVLSITNKDKNGQKLMTTPKLNKLGVMTRSEPMLKLNLKIWDSNGNERLLTDWIVLNEQWNFKLRHLCDSIGILDLYESKSLKITQFVGKTGVAQVIISISKDPKYSDSNSIKDYIKKQEQKPAEPVDNFVDDTDLPF